MALYDRPLTRIIEEEALPELPEPFSSRDLIQWVQARYPKFKDSTIRAHLRSMSANDPNKRHYSSPRGDVLFKLGPSSYRRYDSERDGFYDRNGRPIGGQSEPEIDEDVDEPTEGDVEFALELHLEEFMEANWDRINFGRPLRLYRGATGKSGRQFQTEIGTIDFLCEDASTEDLVVVELKKGRSSDKVLGQCQRYMGWVQEKLAKPGQNVRGLIIAPEQDDRLQYALKVAPNVDMLCYRLSFQLVNPDESTPHD